MGHSPNHHQHLLERMTPQRKKKMLAVVAARSRHFIGIMENIYDQGNVHAVIRSSESFGFYELAQVASQRQKTSSRVTSGADKWVEIKDFTTIEKAVHHYHSEGYRIGATALCPDALPLDQVDFTVPTALIFGNEKEGCSQKAQELSDFRCLIPSVGFTQSFNISVAAAITFYHVRYALKQHNYELTASQQNKLLADYLRKCYSDE